METIENKITLSRKKLYDLIWDNSVSFAANKYGVSYQVMKKFCSDNDIPVPNQSYYGFRNMHMESFMHKTPLPQKKEDTIILTVKPSRQRKPHKITVPEADGEKLQSVIPDSSSTVREEPSQNENNHNAAILSFLPHEEREKILYMSDHINDGRYKSLHPTVSEYKKKMEAWQQKLKRDEWNINHIYSQRETLYAQQPFEYFDQKQISHNGIKRAYTILSKLFCAVEDLGGSVDNEFNMKIHSDYVKVSFNDYST